MGLPMGMAGMLTPSRISHHFGFSKENGVSALPSVILTGRLSSRSKALRGDAALSSEPHSASWMAADGVQGQEAGLDLGKGTQDPRLGVVLFVDPEPGEGGLGRDQGQVVGRFLLVDVLEQI